MQLMGLMGRRLTRILHQSPITNHPLTPYLLRSTR
jgi:hypothetical protein